MLCLIKYFGIIMGDLIDEDDPHWKLYLYLRKIVDIIFSPRITTKLAEELSDVIEKHNSLYISLFGCLKPKLHLLVHYARISIEFGPLLFLACMRLEAKHKEFKAVVTATSCSKNLLKTIAIKQILKMCTTINELANERHLILGSVDVKAQNIDASLKFVNFIISKGTRYTKGTILVTNNLGVEKEFGRIVNIGFNETNIVFYLQSFEELYFDSHIYAYAIDAKKSMVRLSLSELPDILPCTTIKKKVKQMF